MLATLRTLVFVSLSSHLRKVVLLQDFEMSAAGGPWCEHSAFCLYALKVKEPTIGPVCDLDSFRKVSHLARGFLLKYYLIKKSCSHSVLWWHPGTHFQWGWGMVGWGCLCCWGVVTEMFQKCSGWIWLILCSISAVVLVFQIETPPLRRWSGRCLGL